ncbi:hypothetical protein [Shimia sp. Alg240-R146]|nr:hypothetical protein [Shimia sp. Alg240-R146]
MRQQQNVKLVVLAIAMALGVVAQAEAQGWPKTQCDMTATTDAVH